MLVDCSATVLGGFQPVAMVGEHRVNAAGIGNVTRPDYGFHFCVLAGGPELFKLMVQVKRHRCATEFTCSPAGVRVEAHDEKCMAVETEAEVFVVRILAHGGVPRLIVVYLV